MRFNDAVSGAVLLVFSIMIGLWSRSFPAIPGQEYGAAVFPTLVATALGACSLLLIISGLRRGGGALLFEGWARAPGGYIRILCTIALVVFYIVAAKPLGFIPTMIVVLLFTLRMLKVRWLPALAVAIIAAIVLQWSFGKFLQVPLPWGVLSAWRF
ncbi:tripartite tricarboxylate transporter TctB family protein [Phyllobacterium salinisoli]|uniref:Tripartite tricarboxylate transporter TctB family protein n=1 Tax=Phyllobacterium salinisoli TaxID=1899321 RepID=A0A368K350_9HYPH|nr:tripartite tricarboxylate transporter TctB family protein [Phyllobacterium salinisoli]RCS22903.1 tripartite tricarboxylate transporter TctB family protein [Phyllobacterium salinisoli]